ncbi:MAG: hypothetical protein AAGA48_03685 [Myxococcota bacterium]
MKLRGKLGVVLAALLVGACSGDAPDEMETPPVEAACIEVTPEGLDFGEVRLGDPASLTLTIRNDCGGSLQLQTIQLENPDGPFVLTDRPSAGTMLDGGDTVDVVLEANPQDYGSFSDRVVVNSDDPDNTVVTVDVTLASVCTSVAEDADDDNDGVPNDCDVCAAGDDTLDADADSVPDACDVCPDADDLVDADADTVPDACDGCPNGDDRVDADADTIPDACDVCAGGDDFLDTDSDTVPDACDVCAGGDDQIDTDLDTVPDACDACLGEDDLLDADVDTVPDACDACPGSDDLLDTDNDTVPDCLDVCPGFDDLLDTDNDTVVDCLDRCPGQDDLLEADGDTVPDCLDRCPGQDDLLDTDTDTVPDCLDVCPAEDDLLDSDADTVADCVDVCPGSDDLLDTDTDTVPDCLDLCPGDDDLLDTDVDTVPNCIDACPNFDDFVDEDQDGVPGGLLADNVTPIPGSCDRCEGFDDLLDDDADSVPDGCDRCPGFDDLIDTDTDTVPDCLDRCPGEDDLLDTDADTVPDCIDACPAEDDRLDTDADTVPDCLDVCPAEDDLLDTDADTVPDCLDACPGADDRLDADIDFVPDDCDACPGFDDTVDGDNDLVADGCDRCPGFNDALDADLDTVPDACDVCAQGDDLVDLDLDQVADACDTCLGASATLNLPAPAPPVPRVDVLLVVEDTLAMQPYLVDIPAGVGGFVNQMNASGADWQLALITTSSPTFIGPVIPGGPNAALLLSQQFGSYGLSATALTEGIEQAYAATQPGGDAAPNSVFFRTDSTLAIVFVTDSADTSLTTAVAARNYWLGLKNQDPFRVRVGAIDSAANDPIDELATLTGGPSFDIATVNFAAVTPLIADFLVGDLSPLTELPLNVVPVPQTLAVSIGGSAAHDWYYDARRHALVFPDGPSLVGPLDVDYIEDCGGTLGACQDGLDNDNDGVFDFPDEPGCDSPFDSNETDSPVTPACSDTLDNDGDLLIDWPAEPECNAASDNDEDCLELATDRGGYTMCEVTSSIPTCPDLSALAPISLGNFGSVQVPLGFDFDFYGTDYSTIEVGANGTLGFSTNVSPSANACLPDAALGDAILLWWDDLDPVGGEVWTRAAGVAPDRTFAVHWRAPHSNGFADIDVRAVLYEKTGDIELCYVDTAAGAGLANGTSATAGIQHGSTSFLEYSCNAPGLVEDLTVRFEHPSSPPEPRWREPPAWLQRLGSTPSKNPRSQAGTVLKMKVTFMIGSLHDSVRGRHVVCSVLVRPPMPDR